MQRSPGVQSTMRMGFAGRSAFAAALICLMARPLLAQVNVTTYHNDISRTGAEHPGNHPHAGTSTARSSASCSRCRSMAPFTPSPCICPACRSPAAPTTWCTSPPSTTASTPSMRTGAVYFQVSLIQRAAPRSEQRRPRLRRPRPRGRHHRHAGHRSEHQHPLRGRQIQGQRRHRAIPARHRRRRRCREVRRPGAHPGIRPPANTADGSGTHGQFNPKLQNQRAALLLENGHVVIAWARIATRHPGTVG